MSLRDWPERVRDIIDAAKEIIAFTEGMDYATFTNDARTVKAVTADFAIIGEAANHVAPEIRAKHPHIPWDDMRRMRNIIVHVYHGIDVKIMWDTLKNDVPELIPLLEAVLTGESQ